MEPLVASSASAVLRPAAAALQSDLAALLRDGRVLAGELVSGSTDGQVLLAIGRHHVPAQSDVRLEPGRPFLFRVQETASGVVLHVLDGTGSTEPALLGALREVVGHERPLSEILGTLAARIRATADAGRAGATQSRLLSSLLAVLAGHVASEGADGGALRELLARSGLRYESQLLALARASSGGDDAALLGARVHGDLKGELLRFLASQGDAALGEEVARALAGLEAEQLFNVARERAGDPLVWSLVIPDGSRWTTLRLALSPRGEREGDGQGHEPRGAGVRLVLGLSLSNTGPLRVDLFLSPEALSVRLLTERTDVAQRLAADAERIAELLSSEGRGVHVSARHASPAEVAFAERPLDIRWLDHHHLMDVQG